MCCLSSLVLQVFVFLSVLCLDPRFFFSLRALWSLIKTNFLKLWYKFINVNVR